MLISNNLQYIHLVIAVVLVLFSCREKNAAAFTEELAINHTGAHSSAAALEVSLLNGFDHEARYSGAPVEGDEQWESLNPHINGINGFPNVMLVAGDFLYIGGTFTYINTIWAKHIVRYHIPSHTWQALGEGVNGEVWALAVDKKGTVYVGGDFTEAGGMPAQRIAKWDGASWSAFGEGINGRVWSLAADTNGNVYAGGHFSRAGTVEAAHIAVWDGSAWQPMGSGAACGNNFDEDLCIVFALAVGADNTLYAGGNFDEIDGMAAKGVALRKENTWQAMDANSGFEYVRAFTFDDAGTLYAGDMGGHVVEWVNELEAWAIIGTQNGSVVTLATDGKNMLYAGGVFSENLMSFCLTTPCTTYPSGYIDRQIRTLAVDAAGTLYAGGEFTRAAEKKATYLAKWEKSAWAPLETGDDTVVYALALDAQNSLYAGGNFSTIGSITANNIAKWEKGIWQPLGTGINGTVTAIEVDAQGSVYAGGFFTQAGEAVAQNIARWDGKTWAAMGGGLPYVNDILITRKGSIIIASDEVYIWNDTGFSVISGINREVLALAEDQEGKLIAIESYTDYQKGLQIWKELSYGWETLTAPSGQRDSYAYAAAVEASGSLLIGGHFDSNSEPVLHNIMRYNGTEWQALGEGLSDAYWAEIHAITVADKTIYAGGYFSFSGTLPLNNIAQWDGSTWRSMGSGTDDLVAAQAIDSKGYLYVGGRFTFAGGTLSQGIARYKTELVVDEEPDDSVSDADVINDAASFYEDDSIVPDNTVVPDDTTLSEDSAEKKDQEQPETIVTDEDTQTAAADYDISGYQSGGKNSGCGCSLL